jgi:ubiquinol-cytochrome c reductase cytochrome c1 subunit
MRKLNAAFAGKAASIFAILVAGASLLPVPARAAEEGLPPFPKVKWSFDGPFGTYDRASAQRGFQVWSEVCAACHSMKLMSYRNLAGIGLSEAQIRAYAASKTVPGEINDQGDPTTRPGLPGDHFAAPYANDKAARAANNGALPPDHSLIVKAREGGATYIYALMKGYVEPPAGVKVPDGLYYNKWFLGHQIHMPQPIQDNSVTYTDGTKATLDQEARDVATFLAFASSPEMETRKHLGVRMVGFFVLLSGISYAVKKQVWSDVHKHDDETH